MSVKRKRNVVTVEQKLAAIERLDKGESLKSISDELGVGITTVKDWRRNRKAIQDFCTQIQSDKALSSRRTLKNPTNEVVDDALWLWFVQERRKGTPLSGPILKEKAIMLHSKIENGGSFTASKGWFERWKKRHGVHFLAVCGEKLSANPTAANEFGLKFKEYIEKEGLHPEQIYNMDETGLNYKRLPDKTFATANEKSAAGFKMNKERVTVALCSNASGTHKLPPLLIGKYQNPRAFKNINVSALPVLYKAQKSAWMDENIFKDWYINEFIPSVRKHLTSLKMPVKAILVLDNASTHPQGIECEGESDIKCFFLPPNVTSIAQPMDQGVIESFKRRYKKKLLSEILNRMEMDGKGLIDVLKTVNIKDVIYMVAKSYEEVESSTIVKSWKKVWPEVEEAVSPNSDDNPSANVHHQENLNIEPSESSILEDLRKLPSGEEIQTEDVQQWIVNADDEVGNELLTDDEIVLAATRQNEDQEEEEELEEVQEVKIRHSEARKAFILASSYIEQQHVSTVADVMFIKKWRDYASKQTIENEKQRKITDFLK